MRGPGSGIVLPAKMDATELRRVLEDVWNATMDGPTGDLDEDLGRLRRWFDPVAQGHRLRRDLALLPALAPELLAVQPPLVFAVDDSRRLVTPEGRCALELVRAAPPGAMVSVTVADHLLIPYDRLLAALYREWSRHRIESVVALLAGESKPLQIPAAGVVLAMLVNRCTSEDRALIRFQPGTSQAHVVDDAFHAAVEAFSQRLASSRRDNRRSQNLVGGWALYEARRRLGEALEVVDAKGGGNGKAWIQASEVPAVIDRVAQDLARGHRARATIQRLSDAFDALVSAFRRELPSMAAFGMVHERPPETERLRQLLLERLESHLSAQ